MKLTQIQIVRNAGQVGKVANSLRSALTQQIAAVYDNNAEQGAAPIDAKPLLDSLNFVDQIASAQKLHVAANLLPLPPRSAPAPTLPPPRPAPPAAAPSVPSPSRPSPATTAK